MSGLAAFASKSVGVFSAEERERRAKLREYEQRQREYELAARNNPMPDVDWRREDEPLSSVQQLYQHVYEMMAIGNTTLFLDVFPLHAFYRDRGLGLLEKCLRSRKNIFENGQPPVLWPIGHEVLEFGTGQSEILLAASLADIDQRMAFVLKAAAQFNKLLHSDDRYLIVQALEDIAEGRGVQ